MNKRRYLRDDTDEEDETFRIIRHKEFKTISNKKENIIDNIDTLIGALEEIKEHIEKSTDDESETVIIDESNSAISHFTYFRWACDKVKSYITDYVSYVDEYAPDDDDD